MPVPRPEVRKHRVYAYLTKSEKGEYKLLLRQKGVSMAHALRTGLKLFFEGNNNSDFSKIYDMMMEVLSAKVQISGKPSSYISKLIEEDWETPRKKAKKQKKKVNQSNANFMKEFIPELQRMQSFDNFGLEKIPEEILTKERPKTDHSSFEAWEQTVLKRKEEEKKKKEEKEELESFES